MLEGVAYLSLELSNALAGIASVPIMVANNGQIHNCTMLAGSFRIRGFFGAEGAGPFDGPPSLDDHAEPVAMIQIRPFSGWLMYENDEYAAWLVRDLGLAASEPGIQFLGLSIKHAKECAAGPRSHLPSR